MIKDFFALYKKQALFLAALFATLILAVILRPSPASYIAAKSAFEKWSENPGDETLYRQMEKALAKCPSFRVQCEPIVVQKLLDVKKTDQALALAQRSISLARKEAPFHASFAETTFLIEKNLPQQALEKAVALKEQMEKAFDFGGDRLSGGSLLFAYNLVRIASLQRTLENLPGEKAAWTDLSALLERQPLLADIVMASFSDNQLTLNQYIELRKKAL